VVTEAMVDAAVSASQFPSQPFPTKGSSAAIRRAKARRNIAIGIYSGAYSVEEFEQAQAVRDATATIRAGQLVKA
jgi:hypothetical protein